MKLLNIFLLFIVVFLFIAPLVGSTVGARVFVAEVLTADSQLNWGSCETMVSTENATRSYLISRGSEKDSQSGEELGKSNNSIRLVVTGVPLEIANLIPPLSTRFSDRDLLPDSPPPKHTA